MREDPIVIVEHDPTWPASFAVEARRLSAALGPLLVRPIEHIGSTAVTGLAAKPIVDMLAVVADIVEVDDVDPPVPWTVAPEPGDEAGRRRSWCAPSPVHRTHHLHVVEERAPAWRDWLAFRDLLRADPEAAARYAAVKREAAVAHGADPARREAYRSAKAPLIAELTAAARRTT